MTDSVSKADAMEPPEEVPSEDAMLPVQASLETAAAPVEESLAPVLADEPEGAAEPEGCQGDAGEQSAGAPVSDAGGELEALRREVEALNDRYLRLAAEFTNYRRRVEQERAGLWGRAQGELVGRLLVVLDDLQRVAGLDLGNATVEAIMEGIDLVDRKFERILSDAGVEVLDPVGERFDPETMEAMMRAPAGSEEEDDRVAMVFQKGYALKGQLLRPARVSVLKLG